MRWLLGLINQINIVFGWSLYRPYWLLKYIREFLTDILPFGSLAGLCTYSDPYSTMGDNATRELAIVVSSMHQRWCLHEADLHCIYSVRFYIDAAASIF